MRRFDPRFRAGVSLTREDQRRFDAIVASHGKESAAKILGCGPATLDKLKNGGFATPQAVERIHNRFIQWGARDAARAQQSTQSIQEIA